MRIDLDAPLTAAQRERIERMAALLSVGPEDVKITLSDEGYVITTLGALKGRPKTVVIDPHGAVTAR